MTAAKKQQMSCPYIGLEGPLDRLRPWADETAVAAALREWALGLHLRGQPLGYGGRRQRPRDALTEEVVANLDQVASALHDIGREDPALTPDQVAGLAFFMIRNVAAGRQAGDYWDRLANVIRRTVSSLETSMG